MKGEDEPISVDELLLRRVRVEKFRTEKAPIISPNAFEPRIKGRDPDVDGISFYRAACLDDFSAILATISPDRIHEYGIVRVPVTLLHSLQLSVQTKPMEEIKGHVVIPELNSADYEANKASYTPIKEKLAVESSKDENILRWPTP